MCRQTSIRDSRSRSSLGRIQGDGIWQLRRVQVGKASRSAQADRRDRSEMQCNAAAVLVVKIAALLLGHADTRRVVPSGWRPWMVVLWMMCYAVLQVVTVAVGAVGHGR